MSNPPERLAWSQRLAAFSWDTPWAWPLAQQVAALTALVLVLLMACVATLLPWWEAAKRQSSPPARSLCGACGIKASYLPRWLG